MKNFIFLLLLLVNTEVQAQPFFIDQEPETITGSFNTFLENDAFEKAKFLSQGFGVDVALVATLPFTVRFRTQEQGWDILVFDEMNHLTDAYHVNLSGERQEISWTKKIALLEQVKNSP